MKTSEHDGTDVLFFFDGKPLELALYETAILNLVWMEGQRHIPSAIRFGVDKVSL